MTHLTTPGRPVRAAGPWRFLAALAAGALAAAMLAPSGARAATASELLSGYVREAGAAADAARGQRFFTERHGAEWSCASCHGAAPVQDGRHAATGKRIAPLAPAFEPARFTDAAKVEKWFRRNCKDVAGRECSAGEKADVLAWLLTLQR